MSRKKPIATPPPAIPSAASPGLWENRLEPWLCRYSLLLALLFTLLGAARIVSTYDALSVTSDEPGHFVSGLQYLTQHRYDLDRQHPPLTRIPIALLPYLSGTRPQGKPNFQTEGQAVLLSESHPQLTVWRMRLGNLPFFLLGCGVLFVWTRRYFGAACALLAVVCFTFIPTVLAHAGLATTDMGLAACLGLVFLAMLAWVEEPSLGRGAIFGLCGALAVLAKFTALIFFPAAAGMAFLFYLVSVRPGVAHLKRLTAERLPSLAVAACVCVFVWWGAYFFSFGKIDSWNVSLPAWQFFDGIRVLMLHNHDGHMSYLLGQASRFGWWYYFPVGLAAKTPLAMLVLLGVGLAACWNNRRRLPYLLPVAFILGILLPAMAGNINIGMRHVLPVFLGFAMLSALGLVQLLRMADARRWSGALAALLLVWLAATGAIHHPDYIPYFNELVPYPQDRVICDSDFDWGQDTMRLARRLRQLGAKEVHYGQLYDDDEAFLEAYAGLPHVIPIEPREPAEGWIAICPTMDHVAQYGLEDQYPGIRTWYSDLHVQERIGTIDLIYVAPGTLKPKQ